MGLTDWLRRSEPHRDAGVHTSPWGVTLWLTGVDYFSSLGYAPGLAVAAAGYVAPLATLLLVLVTFLAAVPVYTRVARHSPDGEGSIKMIERLTAGWGRLGWIGKVLVLVLIGFAMTDFVITVTLSAADATHHILENPILADLVPHRPVAVTAALVLGLCVLFLVGFREAIAATVVIGVPFVLLSAVVVVRSLVEIAFHPERLAAWWTKVAHFEVADLRGSLEVMSAEGAGPVAHLSSNGVLGLVAVSLLVFPKLALGLSGFETGVSVMPHVRGPDIDARIANTQKMLTSAAVLMCTLLLGANLCATVLIPEAAFATGPDGKVGEANGRALAWLAHELLGSGFGTVYDVATCLILWFAGASAIAGLLSILPRYLPRFGMSPTWLGHRRPLVLAVTAVCLVVNAAFGANVEAQGGAYATGVLVLMASGAFAVLLAEWRHPARRLAFGCILATFSYVLVVNVAERPDGLKIAGLFVLMVLGGSVWSRWLRLSELRVHGMRFVDAESEALWQQLSGTEDLVLVPVRSNSTEARANCEARRIQRRGSTTSHHVFLHVELLEDTSQFQSPVQISVRREGDDFVIEVGDAVAVANAIAYVAVELGVREVVIGLLDNGTPFANALMYLVFGTGEIGYGVRAIFMRLREDWLAEQQATLLSFDAERDDTERALLRDLVLLPEDERRRRLEAQFEREHARFAASMPRLRRLPHLILFE